MKLIPIQCGNQYKQFKLENMTLKTSGNSKISLSLICGALSTLKKLEPDAVRCRRRDLRHVDETTQGYEIQCHTMTDALFEA